MEGTTTTTKDTPEKPEFDWKKWTLYDPEVHKLSAAEEIAPGISVLKIREEGKKGGEGEEGKSGNGRKKRTPTARRLEEGDTATFHYITRRKPNDNNSTDNNNSSSSTEEYSVWCDKGKGVRWAVGRGSLIPALECTLSQMVPGERALCWASAEWAYGAVGALGGEAVLFEVELAGVSYRKVGLDDRSLTDAERLAEARRARAAGRAHLAKKPEAHKAALREFNRGLQLLEQIVIDEDDDCGNCGDCGDCEDCGEGEGEGSECGGRKRGEGGLAGEVAEEKFYLHLNDAYVYMLRTRLGVASEWKKAVEHARAAVEVQGEACAPESVRSSAKGQYRLGCAYLGMGDAAMARVAAERAAAMAPGDKAVAKLVADVEALQRSLDKTSPFLGMFNRK